MLEETSPGALNLSPGRIPGDPGAPGNCLQIACVCVGGGYVHFSGLTSSKLSPASQSCSHSEKLKPLG